MIAVRSNERDAAAIGISVYTEKLYAFALAAMIAGLGGVLMAYRFPSVNYADTFSLLNSVNVVLVAVTGGIATSLCGDRAFGWLRTVSLTTVRELHCRALARALSGAVVVIVLIGTKRLAQTHNLKHCGACSIATDPRTPQAPLPDVSTVKRKSLRSTPPYATHVPSAGFSPSIASISSSTGQSTVSSAPTRGQTTLSCGYRLRPDVGRRRHVGRPTH